MDSDQQYWEDWAQKLHSWGISEWVISALDIGGPLAVLGAQLITIGSPLLGELIPQAQLQAASRMLEEPSRTKAFTSYLKETREQR